jgi:hypothetical protein
MGILDTLSTTTTMATTLSNLILVSPEDVSGIEVSLASAPVNPTFVFDYEGENTILLETDITDHAIEDNTAIQDQAALRPEIVTTHGFVGELNDVVPPVLKYARIAVDKLLVLSAYIPEISATALIIYNKAAQAYQVAQLAAAAAVSAWNTLGGSSNPITGALGDFANQNKQQKAFLTFYGYWKNRTFFTVKTPWAKFDSMMIKSLRAVQDADTRTITDFEVTFKKVRLAKTITLEKPTMGQGRFMSQMSSMANNGKVIAGPDTTFSTGLWGV